MRFRRIILLALTLASASFVGTADAEPTALPTVLKTFNPASIVLGDSSTLTITLTNPNAVLVTLTGDLVDTLPAHIVIANSTGAGTTCRHGAVTATPGAQTITLSDDGTGSPIEIPIMGSCIVNVRVTTDTAGTFTNTIPAGALQTDHGNNPDPTSATLSTTAALPTIAKAFNPAATTLGDDSTLTITLANTNHIAATLTADLVDTLPAGMIVSSPSGAGSTCAGGNVTATPGADTVTLATGAAIPIGGSCIVNVRVTTDDAGIFTNTIGAGDLQTDLGDNPDDATATLSVTGVPPTVAKTFNPGAITVGNRSTLTITLHNTDHRDAVLTADLVDHLPANVVVDSPAGAGSTCPGGAVVATPGAGTVTLGSGAAIPDAGSCIVNVGVVAMAPGTFINMIEAGALQTDLGDNPDSASATLTATATPPTLTKSFAPTSIIAHGVATLTVTLSNANGAPATLIAPLTDALPASLVVANPVLVSTTCSAGHVSATTTAVTLAAGAQIPSQSSCTVTAAVTSAVAGSYTNTLPIGALATNFGSNAAAASAGLSVSAPPPTFPPAIVKGFAPAHVLTDESSRLMLVLFNANASPTTLTSQLTDNLPGGLVIADPATPTTNCTNAAVSASSGSTNVSINAGARIPAGSCVVAVSVMAHDTGSYVNNIPVGALETDIGLNAAATTATLVVEPRNDEIFANGFDSIFGIEGFDKDEEDSP